MVFFRSFTLTHQLTNVFPHNIIYYTYSESRQSSTWIVWVRLNCPNAAWDQFTGLSSENWPNGSFEFDVSLIYPPHTKSVTLRYACSDQGPSAPLGRWWVGRQTSDVFSKRRLHRCSVGHVTASSLPLFPRLLGWHTSSIGELDKSTMDQ